MTRSAPPSRYLPVFFSNSTTPPSAAGTRGGSTDPLYSTRAGSKKRLLPSEWAVGRPSVMRITWRFGVSWTDYSSDYGIPGAHAHHHEEEHEEEHEDGHEEGEEEEEFVQ